MSDIKFHLVVAMYNVEEWIAENIAFIKNQTFSNFQVILIDDISTDKTIEIVQEAIAADNRFKLIINDEKKYKTRNVVEGIALCNARPEDVIVLVDGDDRLFDENVLQKVADTYQQQNCWMTYGCFQRSNGTIGKHCRPYSNSVIKNNSFRKNKWFASHLKTFKYKLWLQLNMDIFNISKTELEAALNRVLWKLKLGCWLQWRKVTLENLVDSTGKYIRRVDDKAFSFPMLEMSGDKAYFIDEVLYLYRDDISYFEGSNTNFEKNNNEKYHTRLIRNIIIHKQKYQRLEQLK
ncbi:hypothetical protein GCM10009111_08560 [Colwellia asteriadis]|uniref:Glycosyltransferase 2-like domain-containing protein n=1 Tax=Colwellia asteriadis TaxID=517723 RepID=A0ABP3WDS7_9GAMM